MKSCIKLLTILAVSLSLEVTLADSRTFGQALLLPSPAGFSRGEGECKDLAVGIANENWRVRKGDVFNVSAVHPIMTKSDMKYSWKVSNGKILVGQGTANLEIKAGGTKTDGFINVSGFVEIRVTVEKMKNGRRCSLDASTKIMVGRHRENNGFAHVDDLILDENKLNPLCPAGLVNAEGQPTSEDMIIDVSTLAKDPENDVLSYNYAVSSGKIVGLGSKVKWDLTGSLPGTYTIDAGVDDGFGIFGRTQRRTITVTDCTLSCGLCSCPEISVSGPENISDSTISTHSQRMSVVVLNRELAMTGLL